MKKFKKKSLIFLGDIHGCFIELVDLATNTSDSLLVQVGDVGLGFHKLDYELQQLSEVEDICESNKNELFLIRGNHDSKERFKQLKEKGKFNRVHLVEDYDTIQYNNKTIQFIGGAISIDRTGRRAGVSYWEDEGVVFEKDKCKKVDILVTHTAPQYCFPQQFNEMVYGWASEDAYLIEDLTDERAVMNEICKLCEPKLLVYGHFHSSWTDIIGDCKYKLLDINETWEYQN